MAKFLMVMVPAEGPVPMAMFRDEKVGRQWAIDHFPGTHRLEVSDVAMGEELKALRLKIRELEAAAAVPPTAPSLSPEVQPPPAPFTNLPQTKTDLIEAGAPHTDINWSGDPDLREHDEAVTPKSVKRRKAAEKKSQE